MFRILKLFDRGESEDDRKIKELMTEVGNELGINEKTRSITPGKAKELGERLKREIEKRT